MELPPEINSVILKEKMSGKTTNLHDEKPKNISRNRGVDVGGGCGCNISSSISLMPG